MAEIVTPLRAGEQVPLRSRNGIGHGFLGRTRPDAAGLYFSTRWLTVAYLPVLPRGRYYLQELGQERIPVGTGARVRTSYRVVGRAPLRADEWLRTLLFCWCVAPAVVLGPVLAAIAWIDGDADAPALAAIGFVVVWLFASIALLVWLVDRYHRRWAPLRTAQLARTGAGGGRSG